MATEEAISIFASELGWMGISWSAQGVYGLTFGNRSAGQALERLAIPAVLDRPSDGLREDLIRRCQAFASGQPDSFLDLQLDLQEMTAFQRRVIRQCRRIGYGQTASYQELARRAGSPGAARAVGNIMARNRIPLIIPCHRVVGSRGALGGFSAPDGLTMKRRLLTLESTSSAATQETVAAVAVPV